MWLLCVNVGLICKTVTCAVLVIFIRVISWFGWFLSTGHYHRGESRVVSNWSLLLIVVAFIYCLFAPWGSKSGCPQLVKQFTKNFDISSQTLGKVFFRGLSIMGTHILTLTVSLLPIKCDDRGFNIVALAFIRNFTTSPSWRNINKKFFEFLSWTSPAAQKPNEVLCQTVLECEHHREWYIQKSGHFIVSQLHRHSCGLVLGYPTMIVSKKSRFDIRKQTWTIIRDYIQKQTWLLCCDYEWFVIGFGAFTEWTHFKKAQYRPGTAKLFFVRATGEGKWFTMNSFHWNVRGDNSLWFCVPLSNTLYVHFFVLLRLIRSRIQGIKLNERILN